MERWLLLPLKPRVVLDPLASHPLPHICSAVGVSLTLDDFQRVSDRVPFICDLKPSGRYVMEDIHKVSDWP